jgi:hypothetical protein
MGGGFVATYDNVGNRARQQRTQMAPAAQAAAHTKKEAPELPPKHLPVGCHCFAW